MMLQGKHIPADGTLCTLIGPHALKLLHKAAALHNLSGCRILCFIKDQDKTVGCIRIWDAGDGTRKRISPLYILPAHRGNGYAQAAIQEAERIHGAHGWQLDTILQETGNCYLYEKMGYHQTSRRQVIRDNMIIVGYEKD